MFSFLWLFFTTTIGYLLGNIFDSSHPELTGFMGFCVGFSLFFFAVLEVKHDTEGAETDNASDNELAVD